MSEAFFKPFNDPSVIEKNLTWLKNNMPENFRSAVSEPWMQIIANQLSLLEAHDGLDHLMTKNEACILTIKPDFDDHLIAKIYENYFIEGLYRFHSKDPFLGINHLQVIFLKLTSVIPNVGLSSRDPEESFAISHDLKHVKLTFSTICPHSIFTRLLDLSRGLNNPILRLESSLKPFDEGFLVNIEVYFTDSINESVFQKARLNLQNTLFFKALNEHFSTEHALLVDAMGMCVLQVLSQLQPDSFSLKNIEKTLVAYKDLVQEALNSFEEAFNPMHPKVLILTTVMEKVKKIDSGNPQEDEKRRQILLSFCLFFESILKTNYFSKQKKALAFRFSSHFLSKLPLLSVKFPEAPFAIFFMKGEGFFGFHIRFKDLSRGGLRTVLSRTKEQSSQDLSAVFAECYGLSYTQQKKNKDIPEGGAKGIIFTDLFNQYELEASKALNSGDAFFQKFRTFIQLQSQKRYILSLLDLVNADEKGVLKDKQIADFYKKAEHLFLGPDENMTDYIIEWIAQTSLSKNYSTKTALISSKPKAGINHKTYGVTSYGVNAYMDQALKFLNIDPQKQVFTVKISGGPDGDVAGNMMLNLKKFYPHTAKLVAITDVSGTIFDPNGLNLDEIEKLFHQVKPLRFYPKEQLSDGGYLLDLQTKKKTSDHTELTLLSKKVGAKLEELYLSGNEMNQLFRQNLHQVKADIFIPAGGRPRTLNQHNVKDFLDKEGKPTSLAIIEGANLYLTPEARHFLEEKGVLIFKDSSANKGGVTCSSYEVIGGLCLSDQEFLEVKDELVKDILHLIKEKADNEAVLLLNAYQDKMGFLTDLSDDASLKINTYKYELLEALEKIPLPQNENAPLNQIVLNYVPKIIHSRCSKAHILKSLSDVHKKAIIACYLAASVVYKKGLKWNPGISELLPLLLSEHTSD